MIAKKGKDQPAADSIKLTEESPNPEESVFFIDFYHKLRIQTQVINNRFWAQFFVIDDHDIELGLINSLIHQLTTLLLKNSFDFSYIVLRGHIILNLLSEV